MGRPRSITTAVARVSAEVMKRIERAMELDANHIPSEAQAKVVLILSKAQATLRTNKPMPGEEDEERPEDQVLESIASLEEETQHLKAGKA